MFQRQEKDDLLRQLQDTKRRLDVANSQQVGAEQHGNGPVMPYVNRHVRRVTNGPEFPSRSSFYKDNGRLSSGHPNRGGGKATEAPTVEGPIADNGQDSGGQLENGQFHEEPMALEQVTPIKISVSREVQTDEEPDPVPDEPPPTPVPEQFILRGLVRKGKC